MSPRARLSKRRIGRESLEVYAASAIDRQDLSRDIRRVKCKKLYCMGDILGRPGTLE